MLTICDKHAEIAIDILICVDPERCQIVKDVRIAGDKIDR